MHVHRSTTLRYGAVTTAVLGLLLLPPVAAPASAEGATARVAFEPLGHSGRGAAGSCLLYRMVAQDAAFEESVTRPGQAFANVTLTEQGDVEKQDVDFCTVGSKGDTFRRAPRYFNSATASNGGAPLYYNPGWTLTPEEAGNPEKARQDVPPATSSAPLGRPDKAAKEASPSSAGANNALSLDQAIVGFDPEAGGFVFGVVAATDGSAELSGYLDHNGDGIKSPEVPTVSPADLDAVPSTVGFTPGGAPFSLAAADAVRTVTASPKTVTAVAGDPSGASLFATVSNGDGQPLAGVRPRLAAEGGPNTAGTTPTWTGSCAASDGTGRSACTYSGQLPGTDQVALYVNQTTSGGTAQRDASEPYDLVEVTWQQAGSSTPAPSATASASTPPPAAAASSAPEQPQCGGIEVSVDRPVVAATSEVRVLVQATPDVVVQLLAASRPSTAYRVVREGTTGSEGATLFIVRPLTSTQLVAAEAGCPQSAPAVVQVRSVLSLGATRVGPRDVTFRGRAIPARTGQLVSVYRITSSGQHVLTGQPRAGSDGIFSVRKVFSGTGRFGFVARTGADTVNAAGASPVRTVDIR